VGASDTRFHPFEVLSYFVHVPIPAHPRAPPRR